MSVSVKCVFVLFAFVLFLNVVASQEDPVWDQGNEGYGVDSENAMIEQKTKVIAKKSPFREVCLMARCTRRRRRSSERKRVEKKLTASITIVNMFLLYFSIQNPPVRLRLNNVQVQFTEDLLDDNNDLFTSDVGSTQRDKSSTQEITTITDISD
ncbi:predicted protein [Nematostella vectensis]|uniref:Uncharacterized protein n=1 Tax=Nematostella vectensis TaxID=45351 RepID=A7S9I6_NEMVE|nr:predicted protein [Nematostella vectensis]|eukprot:XP_001631681.1 predicted protein [Nematostella vectensis]